MCIHAEPQPIKHLNTKRAQRARASPEGINFLISCDVSCASLTTVRMQTPAGRLPVRKSLMLKGHPLCAVTDFSCFSASSSA